MVDQLKSERTICGYIDEMGMCRFNLKKCEEVPIKDCPSVKDMMDMVKA